MYFTIWILLPRCFNIVLTNNTSYGLGYGQTGISSYEFRFDNSEDYHYTYVKKGSLSCGTPPPVSIPTQGQLDLPISIYPNPASTKINIKSNDFITEVELTNLMGQIIYTNTFYSKEIGIDVSHFQTGMYLIKVNGIEFFKFILE